MTRRPVARTLRSTNHKRPVAHGSGFPSQRALKIRRRFLLGVWVCGGTLLLGRSVQLQVLEGAAWREEADRQHQMQGEVPAPRGAILDREGLFLALSHETFRVALAPHELTDRGEAAELLASALDLSLGQARRYANDTRRWVTIPGRFPPAVRDALSSTQGVYVERELRRAYPHDELFRGVLGAVVDGAGAGGVEQEYEEILRGTPGTEVVARDSEGRPIPGETWLTRAPEEGGSVVLTLDAALQEIAHEALREAVETTGAEGGDLIVTEPWTGEILAIASLRGGETSLAGINTPYEPGSTLKPFTVATLLRENRATMADSVDTGAGSAVMCGRTIQDVSPVGGMLTLARALQVSSNVGIAKIAGGLEPDEQYEGLRDFGFGVSTGVSLPGESSGVLRRPNAWSCQSAASLAIGYEVNVTPIQMAMAYGAIANGGILMEPRLVRELRDADGEVIERFEPEPVRRVVSEEIAEEITATLVGAVETGTGTQARLASFAVAGKSGTARAYGVAGYEVGEYIASFVGFFPAEEPQLVIYVKLERPQGAYYGGATAAPVTRATMEAILAARRPPLDREALAAIADAQRLPTTSIPLVPAALTQPADAPSPPPLSVDGRVTVPDLRGLSPRAAARRLHSMGLSVVWESAGSVTGTIPARGTLVPQGDTIQLLPVVAPRSPGGARRGDD